MTYVEVGGLRTWHEVHGEGQPVVLLHGAFAGASSWSAQTPVLARAGYRVHVPERRGHAHTPDLPGPLTYGVMADDTVAYLDGVVGGPARLVGWSDGAVVALLVALRRPDLVDRQVLIGQYYNSSGKVSGGLVDQLTAGGDQVMGFLRAGYDPVSPDGPEHFPVVYAKTLQMIETEPELDLAALAAVGAPTLVLQGDRDEVTPSTEPPSRARCPRGGWRCSRARTSCPWRARTWSTPCRCGSSEAPRRSATRRLGTGSWRGERGRVGPVEPAVDTASCTCSTQNGAHLTL